MEYLLDTIQQAGDSQELLPTSVENLITVIKDSPDEISIASIEELAQHENWQELNNRFFKKLTFGTGGLRGRTIAHTTTKAEWGDVEPTKAEAKTCPQFPAVGSACLNPYNLSLAMQGVVAYVKELKQASAETPKIIIGHDTRFFYQELFDFLAKVATELGCDIYGFEGARSTPQVSFAVRYFNADAGIVLTASHNPYHDNGFKVYQNDGSQLAGEAATAVMQAVSEVKSSQWTALRKEQQGELIIIPQSFDETYQDALEGLLLRDIGEQENPTKVVFTNLHGTGGVISVPVLKRLGFDVLTVTEQDEHNGAFPTVVSPNPENAPALAMGIELAQQEQADIVIGTDPDADRMGVAVRNSVGEMQLLTGNQIGSLMLWYRLETLQEQGVLTSANKVNAKIVKTFVTTDLQQAIAQSYGVPIVNTLTGFKYIAAKLAKYEDQLLLNHDTWDADIYRQQGVIDQRQAHLEQGTFFVFGGEESYGYLGADFVRDKDANGSVVMLAEVAAYAQSKGKTMTDLLDTIYAQLGYYLERGESTVLEGAQGAEQIKQLMQAYQARDWQQADYLVDGSAVAQVQDFAATDQYDEEGELLAKENMLIIKLEDGRRFAIRPSGTEPKIKYYLFAQGQPTDSSEELQRSKESITNSLESLWQWLAEDQQAQISN